MSKFKELKQKLKDNKYKIIMGTVLNSLREATKRQLRYAEGRLANGLKSGTISSTDEQLRREEVEYFSKELEKIFEAEKLLTKGD